MSARLNCVTTSSTDYEKYEVTDYPEDLSNHAPSASVEVYQPAQIISQDLSSLELSPADQAKVYEIINSIIANQQNGAVTVSRLKKAKNLTEYTLLVNQVEKGQWLVPFQLEWMDALQVIVCSRKLVGKGSEKRVRLCFNLATQAYYVKKTIGSDFEKWVIDQLYGKNIRGLSSICYQWSVVSSQGNVKYKFLEYRYDHSLETLLETQSLTHFHQKYSLIEDLLIGIQFLHQCVGQVPARLASKTSALAYKMFHQDIAPKNIVVQLSKNGCWKAALTDFGFAGRIDSLVCGRYSSPEYYTFKNQPPEKKHASNCITHHLQYGQLNDIWSLGMVFAAILSGQIEKSSKETPLTGLPYVNKVLKSSHNLAQLEQQHIDASIDYLKASYDLTLSTRQLWDLVKLMLRVKPEERITAEKSLKLLYQIGSKN